MQPPFGLLKVRQAGPAGDGDNRQGMRRSNASHAVKGRLSEHRGGQFGLGDDHEIDAIDDRFQAQ